MACGHGRPAETTGATETPSPVTPANSTVQTQTTPLNIGANNTPTTTTPIVPSGTVMSGLNPEHGKPGHRCDIAVGTPLNSQPTQQTTPAVTTAATTPVTTPINISADKLSQAATTPVAPGMNPAHGQPGHRCDIAVGAPLNSKPTQQPATIATTPVTSPTQNTDQPVLTKVAPGMNPAHGEPGHRCDIAVGAPLNSKPTQPSVVPTPVNNQTLPSIVPIKTTAEPKKDNR